MRDDDEKMCAGLRNEKEWRGLLFDEIMEIKKSQSKILDVVYENQATVISLRTKMGFISAIIGLIAGMGATYITNFFVSKIGKG